jgi:hypothetical protein
MTYGKGVVLAWIVLVGVTAFGAYSNDAKASDQPLATTATSCDSATVNCGWLRAIRRL